MNSAVKDIVIVGGGSAGWLAAGVIAAEHMAHKKTGISVTLIESPDVKPIGVGEGTWPTMRTTLSKIGVSETDLFRECEASFKQGAKFCKWVTGKDDDYYYHPLVLPQGYGDSNLVYGWQGIKERTSFADALSFQGHLCDNGCAPKQITTPEYAAVANYAYHLNSTKLGEFLKKHCIKNLGVKHIVDHVVSVKSSDNGNISALATRENGALSGDLFIDCSGFSSLLLGQHFKVPFVDKKNVLFNDSALAVQVPYEAEDSQIASHTISTAQSSGWVWDIGLPSRRGVGYVYSSAHITDEDAEIELVGYVASSIGLSAARDLSLRKISIRPGHREKFWHKNCVAIGMAAGFIEPLEASALVLVELSASMISEELPATQDIMDTVAQRFNRRFLYRWDRIIDFLKLHYVLTQRTDTAYWVDNCREETIPDRLIELMKLWQYNPPSKRDFYEVEEVFGSASWQYVLYGMGFETFPRETENKYDNLSLFSKACNDNKEITKKYLSALPSNRELINKIYKYGMQKI